MKLIKINLYCITSSVYFIGAMFYIVDLFIDLRYKSWNINSYGSVAMEILCILGLLGSFSFINKKYRYFKYCFYLLLPLTVPYFIIEIMKHKNNMLLLKNKLKPQC